MVNENSLSLWHRRLGLISIERIKQLMNDGVLKILDFTDFGTCIDCINRKQTNKISKSARRSSKTLEIIHIDIRGPFTPPCFNGQRYFISFIDDHTRFIYFYLVFDKAEAFDTCKSYKAEVGKQKERKIKIVRYDREGEYFGKYTENG